MARNNRWTSSVGTDAERQREFVNEGGHDWESPDGRESRQPRVAASYHASAAFHYEAAAHDHREAEFYCKNGNYDAARLHHETAMAHARSADEFSRRAQQELGRNTIDTARHN